MNVVVDDGIVEEVLWVIIVSDVCLIVSLIDMNIFGGRLSWE